MTGSERRKFQRIDKKLDITCRTVGNCCDKSYLAYTVNVCPGGIYFETEHGDFAPGNIINLKLSIPPTEGLLEFGGKISGYAKVLRTIHIGGHVPSRKHGIAVEFCEPPKLCL